MGYYTTYKMQIFDTDGNDLTDVIESESDLHDIITYPDEHSGDDVVSIARILSNAKNGLYYGLLTDGSAKWYDHEIELIELSKDFPNVVFELSGCGEEQGDIWRKYFHNGKMDVVRPECRWPEFNINNFAKY